MKTKLLTIVKYAIPTLLGVYLLYTQPSFDPVLKSGVVAGKAYISTGGKYSRTYPAIGMRFDDGTEEDIRVTIATYESLDKGERASFYVRPPVHGSDLFRSLTGFFLAFFPSLFWLVGRMFK